MSDVWYVYILRCADNSLYTGIATDVKRRLDEHNNNSLGAKYTRGRRPVILVYMEKSGTRSEALKREHAIRILKKRDKETLISNFRKK